MRGRPTERSSASTDSQYFSHSAALRKFGSKATPSSQKSVVIPHHFPHSIIETGPRVLSCHGIAQRALTLRELHVIPGEDHFYCVSVLLRLTRIHDHTVFEDAIVHAACSSGDRNASRGNYFEHRAHLALNPRRDVGVATGL